MRNVEVRVLDNDAPGLVVTQVDAAGDPDNQTIVIEGTTITRVTDSYTVALAKAPAAGTVVKVRVASVDGRLVVTSADTRFLNGVITFTAALYTGTTPCSSWCVPSTTSSPRIR